MRKEVRTLLFFASVFMIFYIGFRTMEYIPKDKWFGLILILVVVAMFALIIGSLQLFLIRPSQKQEKAEMDSMILAIRQEAAFEKWQLEQFVINHGTVLDATHPDGRLVSAAINGRKHKFIIGYNGTPNPDGSRSTFVMRAETSAKTYQEAVAAMYPTLSGVKRIAKNYQLSHRRT